MRRREFIMLVGAATAWPLAVRARTYSARPVRIIVGYAAGGSKDIVARQMGHRLSQRLGQPIHHRKSAGAGANIATEAVVTAAPDGYTLLLANPANAINTTLYKRLDFVFLRDIAPVASMIRQPLEETSKCWGIAYRRRQLC
jgi:tripartite-type tricarboxylate transporter receptor subunit TctC